MHKYVARRLMLFVPALLGTSMLVFVLMRVIPGDVAMLIAVGGSGAESSSVNRQQVERIRAELGLDRPLWRQYVTWIGDFATLRWGESVWVQQSVTDMLKRRYPMTVQLALMALALSWTAAVPMGILSAVRQDRWLDHVLRVLSVLGLALPGFWIGILVIYSLAIFFNWASPMVYTSFWESPGANLSQLIFPALVLGLANAAVITRMTRSAALEVLREDYIRTARAKGLGERLVVSRHLLKNALIPVVTIGGVQLGHLISGSLTIEVVFNLPGLGAAMVDAVQHRDYPVVQTLVLLFTLGFGLVNLGVDLLYAWLDPRVRYG